MKTVTVCMHVRRWKVLTHSFFLYWAWHCCTWVCKGKTVGEPNLPKFSLKSLRQRNRRGIKTQSVLGRHSSRWCAGTHYPADQILSVLHSVKLRGFESSLTKPLNSESIISSVTVVPCAAGCLWGCSAASAPRLLPLLCFWGGFSPLTGVSEVGIQKVANALVKHGAASVEDSLKV